ncbi:MAG: hypothetical protein J1F31_01020 [Erysipelotrichales bacterium]|nr:hypothetical protein [Erysipelotrichales bacterium]
MQSKKIRNIFSIVITAFSFGLIVTMGIVLINKQNHNLALSQEKARIEQELANPDDDIYDVYNIDNYTVYDEKTIIEYSK